MMTTGNNLILILSTWTTCSVISPSSLLFTSALSFQQPSTSSTKVDISDYAPRDVGPPLYEWSMNYGVQTSNDCLELTTSNMIEDGMISEDYFAITNQNLAANSPIICIPNSLMMTGTKSWQDFASNDPSIHPSIEQILSSKEEDNVSAFYLFLKILKEYELGEQSPWYPWLNSLPRYYTNGASMTDFCYGCLPPYAAKLALTERTRLKRFELALNVLSDQVLSTETKTNTDLTKWAYNVVHTRYFDLPGGGDCCLVPMADYLNHGGAAETNAYINYDDDGNCYVYSTQDIAAGQPLKICYGDPTNPSKLLARYGFLDESSSGTYCKWIADKPTEELSNLGYPTQMLFYNDGNISMEVWDVLLYDVLGQSLQEREAFYQAHMAGDQATKQIYHQKHFKQTLATLKKHVDYLVNELDELSESTIWKRRNEKHPRLPLLMKHNDFVRDIFNRVQQNLDTLG